MLAWIVWDATAAVHDLAAVLDAMRGRDLGRNRTHRFQAALPGTNLGRVAIE
jgi:hypothetical protein